MIDLYTWDTPNGHKVSIALEELARPYRVHLIDITKEGQNDPAFRAIAPNGKIPAIVDHDAGVSVFESGAILMHLAEGTDLLPSGGQLRADALSWTFWQMAGLGPMIGQWGHFAMREERDEYAIERYLGEVNRLFRVLDERLRERPFIAGEAYTIADIASFPWVRSGLTYIERLAPSHLPVAPAVAAWQARIADRLAVQRGLAAIPQP